MAKANNLWTKTAFAKVPTLKAQDGKGDDAIAYVKVFSPLNGWRWYITEYDPTTGEAFGLVQGHEVELGTIPLNNPLGEDGWDGEDMQYQNDHFRGRFIMPPFERDLHFKPTTIGAIRESIERGCPA
jgi:hypothetical protein